MKYRKLLMFTICAIAIIGAGCAKSENEDNEERAIQLLQEKYGEQFRVIRVDDSKLMERMTTI